MKGRELYALQQQMKAARALERQTAMMAGEKPPKVGIIRRLLGVKDPRPKKGTLPPPWS